MLTYEEKLDVMTDYISENITDVESLCLLLDVDWQDIVSLFPDKVVAGYDKVFVTPTEEDDPEEETFEGFQIEP